MPDEALARLAQVKHLVVVMMENRSFDHMLGYLKMEGMPEVDGLTGNEFNLGPDGSKVGVTRFDADGTSVQKPGEALTKALDPDHSKAGVKVQVGNGYGDFANGGFVKAFLDSRNPADNIGRDLWMVPMGYYGGKDLPAYDFKTDNFAFFDRKKVSILTQAAEALIVGHDSFLDDAAKGQLRDVSWIDPNFIDLEVLDPASNDDHPPCDIRAGQAFILELYDALVRSPAWEDTVLVIVYDEHGGFYDHVAPPPVHDDSGYATLGVRVPALIVGPRVQNTVCHQVFDHTSLINTILTRFAADPAAAIGQMPQRVRNAAHIGQVLADTPRTDIPSHEDARNAIDEWRTKARELRRAAPGATASPAADGTGQPLVLQDFQHEFAQFAIAMRQGGLPPGQP